MCSCDFCSNSKAASKGWLRGVFLCSCDFCSNSKAASKGCIRGVFLCSCVFCCNSKATSMGRLRGVFLCSRDFCCNSKAASTSMLRGMFLCSIEFRCNWTQPVPASVYLYAHVPCTLKGVPTHTTPMVFPCPCVPVVMCAGQNSPSHFCMFSPNHPWRLPPHFHQNLRFFEKNFGYLDFFEKHYLSKILL